MLGDVEAREPLVQVSVFIFKEKKIIKVPFTVTRLLHELQVVEPPNSALDVD